MISRGRTSGISGIGSDYGISNKPLASKTTVESTPQHPQLSATREKLTGDGRPMRPTASSSCRASPTCHRHAKRASTGARLSGCEECRVDSRLLAFRQLCEECHFLLPSKGALGWVARSGCRAFLPASWPWLRSANLPSGWRSALARRPIIRLPSDHAPILNRQSPIANRQ